jgi:type I restriction enzyme S subunit
LRVADFSEKGTIDTRDLRYVTRDVRDGIKNYIITTANLYISIAGTIGKTGTLPKSLDGTLLTENACRLVFRPDISNRFVYHFTTTPSFTKQAGLNTRTAAQPKLALSRLATIELKVPPLAEQEKRAQEFDCLGESTQWLESLYTRKLTALDELKQSLLQQAFAGEL